MNIPSRSNGHQLHLKAEAASDLGRFNDAQRLAAEAIACDPHSGDGYASLGRALIGLRKFDEARMQFENALGCDGENYWYLLGLSTSLKCIGNLPQALKTSDILIGLYPNYAQAFRLRGNIHFLMKNNPSAIADYETALEKDPLSADTHDAMGLYYLSLDNFPLAESHLRASLAINPESSMTLNNLGVALEGQSKIKDAALAYKAAVLIDPSLEIAKVNAKNAIHQYVHIGGGALLVVLWIAAKFGAMSGTLLRQSFMTPFMITMLLSSIGVVLGGIGLYTWLGNQRRKRELLQADPTILELYQKLKKERRF